MKVTEIAQDILLIENALPLDLIEKIKAKVIETNEMNCVKLYDHKEIFNEFMDHWYSTIEIEFMKFCTKTLLVLLGQVLLSVQHQLLILRCGIYWDRKQVKV